MKTKSSFVRAALLIIAFTVSTPVFSQDDKNDVERVLLGYHHAIEKLDTTGTTKFFAKNSIIVESGGIEGTYQYYKVHHLTPEFNSLSSLTFENYKVEITMVKNYAFAIETYNYSFLVQGETAVEKFQGVTSSVLKKEKKKWVIIQSHFSSRKSK